MKITDEQKRIVEQAAIDKKYQIVCRNLEAGIFAWYITTTSPDHWNWYINEYRILKGCSNPPDEELDLDNYSVWYCGYNYYFKDEGSDGKMYTHRVMNVFLSEKGEWYTTYLQCSKIRADTFYANNEGIINFKNDTVVTGDFYVKRTNGTDEFSVLNTDGKTTVNVDGDVKVNGLIEANTIKVPDVVEINNNEVYVEVNTNFSKNITVPSVNGITISVL